MVAIKHAPLAQRAMMAAVAVELKKKVSAIARVQSACARAGVMQLVLGLVLGRVLGLVYCLCMHGLVCILPSSSAVLIWFVGSGGGGL
jgi:hypothetical protein